MFRELSVTEICRHPITGGPRASIYLPPPSSPDSGAKQLRELIDLAVGLLEQDPLDSLAPKVREALPQPEFARQATTALGIFASESISGFVRLPPSHQMPLAVVSQTFHLKPVLRWLSDKESYFVLRLGRDGADLFTGDSTSLAIPDRVASGPPPKDTLQLNDWIDHVDVRLGRKIRGWSLPIVLAASTRLRRLFLERTSHPQVIENGISEAVFENGSETVINEVRRQLTPLIRARERDAVEEFLIAKNQGRACWDLHRLGHAAVFGRIKHLLVAEDRHLWGYLDRGTGEVLLNSGKGRSRDDDVLDDLAELTWRAMGEVTIMRAQEMPSPSPVSAILRW